MKGEEEILPLTRITTRYDNNNQIITEVTEDYDRNEVKITIPLYYLFGLTEKPAQMPELEKGDYKIQIYTLNTASTPISTIQIKANDMPFVLKFYHHDHLGTVRYITNESGEILHTTDTLAYGEELTAPYEDTNDKVLNTITYTGHEKDYETNLTYMLARYYSQGYGRFLSPDPGYDYDQLDPMSWNLYSYVRGNPVKHLDPTGKRTWGEAEYRAIYEAAPEEGKAQALEQYGKTQRVMGVIGLKGIKATAGVISKASGIASGFTAPLSVIPVMAEVTGALITINTVSSAVELGADAALVALGEEKIETFAKDGVNYIMNYTISTSVAKIPNDKVLKNFMKANVNFVFSGVSALENAQKKLQKKDNSDNRNNQSTSQSTEPQSMPLNFSLVPENKGAKTLFKDLPCFQAVSNDPTNNNCGGM